MYVGKLSKAGGADFAEPVTSSDNVSRFDSQTVLSQVAVLDFVAVLKLHNQTVAAFLSRNARPVAFCFNQIILLLVTNPKDFSVANRDDCISSFHILHRKDAQVCPRMAVVGQGAA